MRWERMAGGREPELDRSQGLEEGAGGGLVREWAKGQDGPGRGSAAGAGGGAPSLPHQVWGESQQRGSQGGARGGGASAHQSEEALWGSLPPMFRSLDISPPGNW